MLMEQQQIEELVGLVSERHEWEWTSASFHDFTQQVGLYASKGNLQTSEGFYHLITNLYHDQARVQIALDPSHPEHAATWETIHGEIVGWLYRWNYYPQDSVMLNEFSPDICAFETLQRKLKDFRYECRLSSYISRITQRCTHEWLRSHAALKRGGSGVTSAAQRRADSGTSSNRQWNICYLSQPIGGEPSLLWEEVVGNNERSAADIVETQTLMHELARSVNGMSADPHYPIVQALWPTLLFEKPNITALAQQYAITPRALFNLKSRIVRRVLPVIQRWQIGG